MRIQVLAELTVKGSDVPIRVKTSDLSVGGCYVEMMFTLEVGKEVNVTLWLGDYKLSTTGHVATRHVQFGNGIQFSSLKAVDRMRLEEFLQTTSTETVQ
jgi:hypothetical protein